jgi:mannose-6-phosphate isomerase-like protein (cupin superfamily)
MLSGNDCYCLFSLKATEQTWYTFPEHRVLLERRAMAASIAVQAVSVAGATVPYESGTWISLLPGAIEGVETTYYLQDPGSGHTPSLELSHGQIFFFVRGAGEILVEDKTLQVSEMAAFVAGGNAPVRISATAAPLEYLEILVRLQDDEASQFRRRSPVFTRYSECVPYTEAIKSPRTTSRTIVPPMTVPRFCMGSVDAWGPDEVAPHSHPMLEQLFFGLPGNACVVTADDAEAVLGERALLHIPPGSRHGVRVHEDSRMHYVWMDFFRREEDLAWVQEQHRPIQRQRSSHP